MKRFSGVSVALVVTVALLSPAVPAGTVAPTITTPAAVVMVDGRLPDDVRRRAVTALREGLAEQQRWVKVHAAEFLLALSYPRDVRGEIRQELERYGDQPEYRIGLWRVLARAARTPAERQEYVDKIEAAARDANAADRLHAVESLAKLGVVVDEPTANHIDAWAADAADAEKVFVSWLLHLSGHDSVDADRQQGEIVSLLRSDDAITRLRAAFVLANLGSLSRDSVESLLNAADLAMSSEPDGDLAQLADAHVIAAAWHVAVAQSDRSAKQVGAYREELGRRARNRAAIGTILANALAELGEPGESAGLARWLDAQDADLALSAAHALLRLDRRRPGALTGLDWTIIAVYFLGMIGIGAFYAGRTENTDDFLLGGRHMSSWMVGLSLFATLLSTLTYLAVPGEMIRHGPVIVMGIASFPLVAWIVGWFIIPFFMRLKVTSAYEILETRFGYGGRFVGSVMFLSLRLFWMAVILYATTDAVIVPLLGWTSAATPWVCAVLGIVTVIYASLGGLRAVVLTDVIQTGILVGGAVLSLVVISLRLGSVGAWWPTEWDPAWTPLRFFDARSPRTILMAFIATGLWYVCTAGSDQMAIQRYLATKDVKAARKMFHITLLMNLTSWILLTLLGFALLGFYRAHPEYLADRATVAADADKLFPRFIAVGLPMGVSGLVVAGLLAAAMSSLSSGINSSCAVISVDYVGRWRKSPASAKSRLRETRLISWGIGAVAVFISMGAWVVPGNLLDVVYRIGNLLVAPLFVLFFMALFVRFATWPATLSAVVASVTVAVVVAYGELISRGIAAFVPGATGVAETVASIAAAGVLWIMPLSLATGVAVGTLGSMLRWGRVAPPLVSDD